MLWHGSSFFPFFPFERLRECSARLELYTTVAVKCLTVLLILIKAVSGQSCRPQHADWPMMCSCSRVRSDPAALKSPYKKAVVNCCMKIFKVSYKRMLAPCDICLHSSRGLLETLAPYSFCFPLFSVAVFLALAAVCCARFIFKPLPHSSSPRLKTIFSSSPCLCFPMRELRRLSEWNQKQKKILFCRDYRGTFELHFYWSVPLLCHFK